MNIQLSKKAPTVTELAEILKRRFSNQYTIKKIGLRQKRVLISKSTTVGAEVSIHNNQISLAPNSVFERVATSFGYLTGFILFFFPFMFGGLSGKSRYGKLENEIGSFLEQKLA